AVCVSLPHTLTISLFFFHYPAPTEIYTLSLHDALPIFFRDSLADHHMLDQGHDFQMASGKLQAICYKEEIESALRTKGMAGFQRSEEHTSELQSLTNLVCRLLLEKKKKKKDCIIHEKNNRKEPKLYKRYMINTSDLNLI